MQLRGTRDAQTSYHVPIVWCARPGGLCLKKQTEEIHRLSILITLNLQQLLSISDAESHTVPGISGRGDSPCFLFRFRQAAVEITLRQFAHVQIRQMAIGRQEQGHRYARRRIVAGYCRVTVEQNSG